MTSKKPRAKGRASGGSRMGVLAGGIALLFVALGIAFALSPAEDGVEGASEYGPVAVRGTALPPLLEDGSDPARGAVAPVLDGEDFLGASVTAPREGRGTVLVFLAHWCPHCRAEVPVIVRNVTPASLPANVDVIGVATSTTDTEANYPPSAWLEREGWPFPVLVDSSLYQAAQAYGVKTFPYFAVIGPDGTLRARTSGELEPAQLQALIDLAAS